MTDYQLKPIADGDIVAIMKTNMGAYVHIINGDGSLYWNRGMIAAWEEAAKEGFGPQASRPNQSSGVLCC